MYVSHKTVLTSVTYLTVILRHGYKNRLLTIIAFSVWHGAIVQKHKLCIITVVSMPVPKSAMARICK